GVPLARCPRGAVAAFRRAPLPELDAGSVALPPHRSTTSIWRLSRESVLRRLRAPRAPLPRPPLRLDRRRARRSPPSQHITRRKGLRRDESAIHPRTPCGTD